MFFRRDPSRRGHPKALLPLGGRRSTLTCRSAARLGRLASPCLSFGPAYVGALASDVTASLLATCTPFGRGLRAGSPTAAPAALSAVANRPCSSWCGLYFLSPTPAMSPPSP